MPDPRWGALALVIALLALAASATSLRNGFAYDDRWIIADNARVHELRALWHYFAESYWPMQQGAALYRPLIMILYSVQWVVGAGAPIIFHVTNVVLAAACAVAVFWVLGFVVPLGVAWLAAALFAESYWPMQQGAALYRPLIMILYSVQWVVGAGAPIIFHVTNVVLAMVCAVTVFWVLGFVVPIGVAWLAAALFAVHPVHVEAVANVVGQAELWAALLMLGAVGLYLRDRRDGPLRRETGVVIFALFTAGILIKEHVIVLPALLVAIELLLCDDAPVWQRLRRLRLLLWPMLVITVVVLAIRVQVLGELGGDVEHPVLLHRTVLERTFIMLNVVPELGRLLLVPVRLYADYSPRQLELYAAPHASQIPGLLILAFIGALFVLTVRRSPPVAFGLAWFALLFAPVSNILIPTGILLAERTLYLPSVGAMLVLAVGVQAARNRLTADGSALARAMPALLAVVLALGVIRSCTRNAFWHDSGTTFAMMVDESPLDFKSHFALGGHLFEKGRRKDAELEWRLAIALMPSYHGVYMELAHKYREAHLCEAALPLYRKALSLEPDLPLAKVSIAACQLELAQWRAARTTSRVAIADSIYIRAFRYIVDRADSALVANDSIDPTIGAKWLARRHGSPR